MSAVSDKEMINEICLPQKFQDPTYRSAELATGKEENHNVKPQPCYMRME